MKIIDCRSQHAFIQICRRLASLIAESRGRYDLVVPIASGGRHVGDQVIPQLPYPCRTMVLKRQRPSTQKKSGFPFLRTLVRRLPEWLQNRLRVLEVRLAEFRFERRRDAPRIPGEVHELFRSPDIPAHVQAILVVDDAVDSGATLADVRAYLEVQYPGAVIHSAALSVTHRNPLIFPEYTLYPRAIVKCPWSLDA